MTAEPTTQSITLLCDRSQYRHCHIKVSELEGPLPAIEQNQKYYYFFKYFEDIERTLALAEKLITQGDALIVTEIPLGYAIWVFEPDAEVHAKREFSPISGEPTPGQAQSEPPTGVTTAAMASGMPTGVAIAQNQQQNNSETYLSDSQTIAPSHSQQRDLEQKIGFPILSSEQYSHEQIQVPDLEEHLAAIAVNGIYYSFFRAMVNLEDLVTIANKLSRRGDDVKITSESNQYTIWVFEPEATLVSQNPAS